jgi:dipeptidyl aminopeptidase/acylaminoacyl peptidase
MVRKVRYDIIKRRFDPLKGTFGQSQVIFDGHAINKSASLPAVSPDGRYLVFTLHDCGSFPVWHKEADLYLLDLDNNETELMDLNSTETESWHSWSSNGKWLVFSSKRGDGITSRPYIAYFNAGKTGKPFVLPQKDPALYSRMFETFNRPEFIKGKITESSGDFERASRMQPLKAIWNSNTHDDQKNR